MKKTWNTLRRTSAKTVKGKVASRGRPKKNLVALASFKDMLEMNEYLQRIFDTFDGTKPHLWNNFVKLFIKILEKQGWLGKNDEVKLELLTSRLTGNALTIWSDWLLEEPEIMDDFQRFKAEFPGRMGGSENPWKLLMDFQMMRMSNDEDIDDYIEKYSKLRREVDLEGCEAVKFFCSLPVRIREILTRFPGEWPRNLKEMVTLTKELAMREKAINLNRKPVTASFDHNNTWTCFNCQEKGHRSFNCPML